MPAGKSGHALTSRSIQSHAKSVASKIVHVTIALVMIAHAMTVLGAIVRRVTVHAPMKRAAKLLAIATAKASAITPHARALPHAGKPALKVAPMIASRPSPLQARRPSAVSLSASVALAHAVALMSVAGVTALSCHVAAVRKIPAYTCSGPLGLSRCNKLSLIAFARPKARQGPLNRFCTWSSNFGNVVAMGEKEEFFRLNAA